MSLTNRSDKIPAPVSRSAALIVLFLGAGCSGPVTVSGKVVDEFGQPLSDVGLHLTGAVATQYEMDAYGGERTLRLDDGEFRVRCGDCSAVHLFFSKEGYHPQSVDLAWFERSRGLTVVLREKGQPVDLDHFRARLRAGPGVDATALVFDGKEVHERTRDEIHADPAQPAPPFITFQPSLTDDGSVAALRSIDRPTTLDYMELDFSAANGGVQLYRPSTRVIHYAFAEMTAAPQDGYAERVTIAASEEPEMTYFYCVIDGRHCKGNISTPSVYGNVDSETVSVSIELYLSPYLAHRSLENARGYVR